MIYFVQEGDYSKTTKYLKRIKKMKSVQDILEQYAQEGVEALNAATPVRTGMTAISWGYEIGHEDGVYKITFVNQNVNKGVPIAVIIQYGHATRNGGWVEGVDYINPAIQPIFDEIVDKIWREVTEA